MADLKAEVQQKDSVDEALGGRGRESQCVTLPSRSKDPNDRAHRGIYRDIKGYIGIYGDYIGVDRTQNDRVLGPKYHSDYSICGLIPHFLNPWNLRVTKLTSNEATLVCTSAL